MLSFQPALRFNYTKLAVVVAAAVMAEPETVAPVALAPIRTMLIDAIRTMIIEMMEMSRCLRGRLMLPTILARETNGLSRTMRITVHRPLSKLCPRY